LVILDASQKWNKAGFRSTAEELQISGARQFDLNDFSDKKSPLPHMEKENYSLNWNS
jgi:3-mercaptopyruvate sulfurtransferase SseA